MFREHSLVCYVTDKTSLKSAWHEIGIDIIAWECDYPHSDCFWPDAPEQVLAERECRRCLDSDINRSPGENSAGSSAGIRSPARRDRDATVAGLRAKGR